MPKVNGISFFFALYASQYCVAVRLRTIGTPPHRALSCSHLTRKILLRVSDVFVEYCVAARSCTINEWIEHLWCSWIAGQSLALIQRLCHITWLIFGGKILWNTVCVCSVTDRRGYAPSQNTCLSCIFLVKSLKKISAKINHSLWHSHK